MTTKQALNEWAFYNLLGKLSDPLARYRAKSVDGAYSDFRAAIAHHVERYCHDAKRMDGHFVWQTLAGLEPKIRLRPYASKSANLIWLGHEDLAQFDDDVIRAMIVKDFQEGYKAFCKAHPIPEPRVHAITQDSDWIPTEIAVQDAIQWAKESGDKETEKRLKRFYGLREQGYVRKAKGA